jgi:two-component system nitrogen regulation response regulator NtrX
VDVPARVVAATNRELEEEVKESRFRRDLFFRLNVHVLRVPPLRDRLSDVPLLVERMVAATSERFGVRRKEVQPPAMEILMAYNWRQNNVRELRNVVERMLIAADGQSIGAEHVPSEIRDEVHGSGVHASSSADSSGARTFLERKAEAERQIVLAALDRNEWHITRTASELGLADHASLLKIMRRHHITRAE